MAITREFLEKLGITEKTTLDAIMTENGNAIEEHKKVVETKDTEITGLKKQIGDRDNDIKELKKQTGNTAELNTKLTELQTKYDTDTKGLQEKLNDQAYDHAAEKYFDGYKFTSNAARKAALADFRTKKLKLADGKFEGADEFIAALKKEDPSAFATEDKPAGGAGGQQQPPATPATKPQFTVGANQSQPGGGDKSPFDFGFTPVRTPKTN